MGVIKGETRSLDYSLCKKLGLGIRFQGYMSCQIMVPGRLPLRDEPESLGYSRTGYKPQYNVVVSISFFIVSKR